MLIYEGPNHSGTGDIAVIATSGSKNRKTGDMIQVWILPKDTLPTDALKTGEDALVCGDCPLRPALGGGCYVNVGQAPNAVWRKYKRGGYHTIMGFAPFDRPLRIGAYGDVAEIPEWIVRDLVDRSPHGHTCYTAQWRPRPDLQDISMASVQTYDGWVEANDLGWSTFRVTDPEGEWADALEVPCPADRHNVQCDKCKLCCGNSKGQRSIYIPAHGPQAKKVHSNKGEK